jgi:hypothetical protein
MEDVKSQHYCHKQASLLLDAGRRKKARRGLPQPKIGLGKVTIGQDMKIYYAEDDLARSTKTTMLLPLLRGQDDQPLQL